MMNVGGNYHAEGEKFARHVDIDHPLNLHETLETLQKIEAVLEQNLIQHKEEGNQLVRKAVLVMYDYYITHQKASPETLSKLNHYVSHIADLAERTLKPSYFDQLPKDIVNLLWHHLTDKDVESFGAINQRNKEILQSLAQEFHFEGEPVDAALFLKDLMVEWQQFVKTSDISISFSPGAQFSKSEPFTLANLHALKKELGSNPSLLNHLSSRLRLPTNSLSTFHMLLCIGADPNADHHGYYLLHQLAASNLLEQTQLAFSFGGDANINKVDSHNYTPLMKASYGSISRYNKKNVNSRLKYCQFLIDHGAEVNQVTSRGVALDFALQNKDRKLAALLIKNGADPSLINSKFHSIKWINKL